VAFLLKKNRIKRFKFEFWSCLLECVIFDSFVAMGFKAVFFTALKGLE